MGNPWNWMLAALLGLAANAAVAHGGAGEETVTPVA